MRQRIKGLFKRLLIGYISNGHTVNFSSQEEVERLTDRFVRNLYVEECFTSRAVETYCWYMDENLSDEFRGFYSLRFKNKYYVDILEEYIKRLLRDNGYDNSDDDSDEFVDVDSDGL